ncbi:hypothetical protein EGW08_022098 [Elysia chlorotica]|uniref:Uncharacterized protein n=1 Tax=Elysia chlorotica TaxID=188477 RepID=A0A433SLX4_ELYCH|nr:hypothetical protein EGW08_022098 [Elysia chlorotica]
MASTDGFTPESRIEQWLFDYLTYKCVSNSTQSREVNETTKMFLEALMSQSVNPDHGTNDIKANLLIVLDCQIQLADLGISNLQSAQSDKLLQSKETVSDFLNMMNGLRNSLVYLKESFGSKSTSLFALCKRCILHTYVIIIQFFHRLKVSPEPLYGDAEISGWTSKFLKKAEKCADSASEKDAVS